MIFDPQVSLALLATCFILRCHFHDPATSDMPIWVRHVVFRWMAQILRFKIPNKRKPSVLSIADRDAVISQKNTATEFVPNNKSKVDNIPRKRASSLDLAFPPPNGINHSFVKQLSYSNLLNGNYKSGPAAPHVHQGDLRSIPRLTVTQAEDWCIASSVASLCSNEDIDQRQNSETCADGECRSPSHEDNRVEELVKMQQKLLEHVQILAHVVAENEQLRAKKYEWSLVASIFDQAFRIAFLLMFFLSTLTIFYFSKS